MTFTVGFVRCCPWLFIYFASTGVPSPPLNCSVSNQTWESLEVKCGEPGQALQGHHRTYGFPYTRQEFEDMITPSDPAELLQDKDKPRYLLTVREHNTHNVIHNVTSKSVSRYVMHGVSNKSLSHYVMHSVVSKTVVASCGTSDLSLVSRLLSSTNELVITSCTKPQVGQSLCCTQRQV